MYMTTVRIKISAIHKIGYLVKRHMYIDVNFVGEFSSCCWVNDIGAGSWGLRISSNSSKNSSPITKMLPIIRLQYGCGSTIKIPVNDSDGDVVICRWAKAEQRECGSYCLQISGNINNCTLDIGSTGIGTYGIAIQIEDFQSRSSNVAFNSIPLQFILDVYTSTSPCSDLPRITGTWPDNSYVPVLPNVTWSYNITAQSSIGSNITEIITVSPKGMMKSSILNGSSFQERYITLNWRPDYSQYGPNILCYAAVDNLQRMSAKNCLFLVVGFVIAQVNSTSITVVWSRPPGKLATTYTLSYTYQGPCTGGGASGTKSIGNTTQYTITRLQEFSLYTLTLTASNGVRSSPPASVFVSTSSAAPSAPPNSLTMGTKTSSSVTISWGEVPCVDQNSAIVGYSFRYGAVTSGERKTVATLVRAMTVTGLAPYTNYSIVVSAINSDGAMGPYSSPLFVVTGQSAPGPVSGLQAINTTFTTITLTWQPPSAPNGVIIMYQVTYSSNGSVNTYNTTRPPVTIKGLVPRTTYTFSVVGYTITGPGIPQQVQTSTAAIPNVTGVVVVATNTTSVRVCWLAVHGLPQDGILTGYTVYYRYTSRRVSDGYISQTFPPTTTWGDITNLNINEVYQLGVAAMVTILGQLYSGEVITLITIVPGDSPTIIPVLAGSLVAEFVFLLVVMVIFVIGMVIYMRRRGLSHVQEPSNHSDPIYINSKDLHSNHRDVTTTKTCDEISGDQGCYEMVENNYN